MRLVDCRRDEVRDIPPGRRHANDRRVERREPLFKGGCVLTFGMYKGKQLSEVPRKYLEWLADQPRLLNVPGARAMDEIKQEVRRWLTT